MICYQNLDWLRPDMIRFICHVRTEEMNEVKLWLNEMIPDGFILHQSTAYGHFGKPSITQYYWLSIYFREASYAALFKLSWKTSQVISS